MATVLEVDAAGQRRDMAAATTALPGVVAEMGGEGLEKGVSSGIGQSVLYRGPGMVKGGRGSCPG
jgi:hypothetical protein